MATEKRRRQDVIDDLFKKRCHEMLTRKQLIDYMMNFYGYIYETSLSYYEDLIHFIKDNVSVDYESDLAQMIEFIEYNIQTAPDSFTRLQWVKEKNKISGLHIQKVQVDGQINNIHTIKLTQVLSPDNATPIGRVNIEQLPAPEKSC
jgi:hypothetical protein